MAPDIGFTAVSSVPDSALLVLALYAERSNTSCFDFCSRAVAAVSFLTDLAKSVGSISLVISVTFLFTLVTASTSSGVGWGGVTNCFCQASSGGPALISASRCA